MTTLKEDLDKACRLIEHYDKSDYKNFRKIYPFSNENLRELFFQLDFRDKNCLTVLGSSDQAMDMYLNGAKSITTFDKNSLAKYYFYLKKAAMLANFSLEEYLKFFCYRDFEKSQSGNRDAFNEHLFSRLVPYLKGVYYQFWSYLFENYDSFDIRMNKKNGLFSFDEVKYTILKKTIGYLDDKNYYLLREKIQEMDISFIDCDIHDLKTCLHAEYDMMYFSNIIQYVDRMYSTNLESQSLSSIPQDLSFEEKQLIWLTAYKELMLQLSEHLKQDGMMIIGYLYAFALRDSVLNESILRPNIREVVFSNDFFQYLWIQSMETIEDKEYYGFAIPEEDACLIYTKKR